ncbi:MAG: peptidylprolyl isomerase [Desulfuromonadales bacterium]|nr:peptidylprolyl isomerase [Desulfuromonadales bacterium]
MKTKVLLVAILAGALMAPVANAEVNPALGKAGNFVLRQVDLDHITAGQQLSPEQKVILVRSILNTKAMAEKAKKMGLDKDPAVQERLGYLLDDFYAKEYLKKVVPKQTPPTDTEVRNYYDSNPKEFEIPASVDARQIWIKVPDNPTDSDWKKAKAKAESILARLNKGEDFTKLAAEASDDVITKNSGGRLGRVFPGKTNSREFEKGLFALKPGKPAIIKSEYGYHVTLVDAQIPQQTISFDQAKDAIRKKLMEDKIQKAIKTYVDQATEEANVEVYQDQIIPKTTK